MKYGLVTDGAEQQVAFYLCESFSMLPFISALEPLRIANRRANKPLYQWRIIAAKGTHVTASNGMEQKVDYTVDDTPKFPMIFVSGPFEPRKFNHAPSLRWINDQAKQGAFIGCIETGCYVLAKAGLLNNFECTTHWEDLDDFEKDFPQLSITSDVFNIYNNRASCAGGSTSIDMMLYLIKQKHGNKLAVSVAESMIHTSIRSPNIPQRMDIQSRIGVNHPALLDCIELMEANIEEPLTPTDLASLIKVSIRQLERLFQRHLSTTPSRYYLGVRLEAAQQLLQSSNMKIVDAAMACGFKSSGHFSSCYHSRFGSTPRENRK